MCAELTGIVWVGLTGLFFGAGGTCIRYLYVLGLTSLERGVTSRSYVGVH